MELIEIISNSLIIFTAASSIFLLLSYTVYKVKDRKRIKPYMREENLVSPVVLLKGNEQVQIKEYETVKKNSRFHIVNEGMQEINEPVRANKSVPVQQLKQNQVISYYSFNKNETMHKLRPTKFADGEA